MRLRYGDCPPFPCIPCACPLCSSAGGAPSCAILRRSPMPTSRAGFRWLRATADIGFRTITAGGTAMTAPARQAPSYSNISHPRIMTRVAGIRDLRSRVDARSENRFFKFDVETAGQTSAAETRHETAIPATAPCRPAAPTARMAPSTTSTGNAV